ncbi:MAG: phosphatase PAP2 family protein [Actinomycetota bacterium]|nr:phosphatase PAP2 family protein [Actinomycetota bacterium]
MRTLGALYPGFVLFVIVATGNHFLFDAVAGGAVIVAAGCLARLASGPTAKTAKP